MEQRPIFIGGLSHTGKTPLRLRLSAHPNLALTRRTYMWPRFYGRYGDLRQPECLEKCLTAMLQSRHILALQPDPERIRREFPAGATTYARLFALFHQHFAEQRGKPRWGDQTGSIERYVTPIFKAFPEARFIHLIRDPRDRHASIKTAATTTTPKIGHTTAEWLCSVDLAKHNVEQYRGRHLLVQYEMLLSEPEQTMRQVCAFIEEPFTPEMLTMEKAIRFGADDAAPNPPEKAERNLALNMRELAFIQQYAGSRMQAFGYLCPPIPLSLHQRCQYALFDQPRNLLQMRATKARTTSIPDFGEN